MIHLPDDARDTIAAIAIDAALTVEPRAVPGAAKMRMATAIGMRKLKAGGMPALLAEKFKAHIDPDDRDDGDEGLNEAEAAVVDGITMAAGAGVGLIADAIEEDTGCECNREILALVRSMLKVGLEVAARSIKAAI
jgi:hypothetical protein